MDVPNDTRFQKTCTLLNKNEKSDGLILFDLHLRYFVQRWNQFQFLTSLLNITEQLTPNISHYVLSCFDSSFFVKCDQYVTAKREGMTVRKYRQRWHQGRSTHTCSIGFVEGKSGEVSMSVYGKDCTNWSQCSAKSSTFCNSKDPSLITEKAVPTGLSVLLNQLITTHSAEHLIC